MYSYGPLRIAVQKQDDQHEYIQQLCEDTGCCPEDLPRAMNDREEWRERVRDIHATSPTWWWSSSPKMESETRVPSWFSLCANIFVKGMNPSLSNPYIAWVAWLKKACPLAMCRWQVGEGVTTRICVGVRDVI